MTGTVLPPSMRAAMWHGPGRPLVVERLPTPRLERDCDVLIRVRAAMFGAALARAATVGHPKMVPPAVLGTLVCGDVVAVGAAVRRLRVGDRVTLDPHPPCGSCSQCQGGVPELCAAKQAVEPGAHAEYVRIRPPLTDHAAGVPAGLSCPEAMLTEIVACVLDASEAAAIGADTDVLVIGCGPVGLIQMRLARLLGARRVFCTVNHPGRSALVTAAGGLAVPADSAADEVRSATGGRGAHVVVEAVGTAATYRLALELVRSGGTVVAFGGCPPGSTLELDLNEVHYRRLRLLGSYHYRPGRFEAAARLLASGRLDVSSLITHRLPLDAVDQAPAVFARADCLVLVIEP